MNAKVREKRRKAEIRNSGVSKLKKKMSAVETERIKDCSIRELVGVCPRFFGGLERWFRLVYLHRYDTVKGTDDTLISELDNRLDVGAVNLANAPSEENIFVGSGEQDNLP